MIKSNLKVAIGGSLILLGTLYGCKEAGFNLNDGQSQVTIVQSVPSQTELFNPDLPFAKDVWIQMIDESKNSIDIEQMYVSGEKGEALDEVIAALERAAHRGVRIRFILSKNMIDNDVATRETIKRIPNLQLRAVDFKPINGGIQHAKFWIFDQDSIFVGSQNFDWKALTEILETGVLVKDRLIAKQLQSIFELDWKIAEDGKVPANLGEAPFQSENAEVRLVAGPPQLNPKNIPGSLKELISLLNGAKKSVRVTLLDFSTYLFGEPGEWRELENVLREAAKRGVKIDLLVSHWNTEQPEITSIKRLSKVENIDVRIATIPELKNRPLSYARVNHSKFMVVDDSVLWVGTSNWSKGYFLATRGIEIIMKRADLASQANDIFNRLWNAPYTEKVDVQKNYPKPRK